jgi:hypothetical protein
MMALTELAVDESAHNMDGLWIHARDGSMPVEAFISRRVMDLWVEPIEPEARRKSLYRAQYNAIGKLNLEKIRRIVNSKYRGGLDLNRQHPFVDILFADITQSGETLDRGDLSR